MPSLERRIGDIIDELKRLGHAPDVNRIDQFRRHLAGLDNEVRTTIAHRERLYELANLSRQAHTLLRNAHERASRTLAIADAARQRELRDVSHPTITSPQPHTVPELEIGWDGFER
ncbi:hypothetical protein AB0C34_17935 [Nocardia sp. NPDC049220]|uniref:hypothetical protein n=1 Tax=Nocardia sp. NPDC049220 TaxID=3155273 RepID=UPI0033D02095